MSARSYIMAISFGFFLSLTSSFQSAAAGSPISCGIQNGKIHCDVTENETKIDSAILNRGNCVPTTLIEFIDWSVSSKSKDNDSTPEEKTMLQASRETLLNNREAQAQIIALRQQAAGPIGSLQLFGLLSEAIGTRTVNPKKFITVLVTVIAVNDPSFAHAPYSFGDSFDVTIPAGCNVLEYAISVNGRVWTWKTR